MIVIKNGRIGSIYSIDLFSLLHGAFLGWKFLTYFENEFNSIQLFLHVKMSWIGSIPFFFYRSTYCNLSIFICGLWL